MNADRPGLHPDDVNGTDEPTTDRGEPVDETAVDSDLTLASRATPAPDLPDGHDIDVDGLGPLFVRDIPGPDDGPTVMLIHGWTASADLNWYTCYRPLAAHARVVAFDQRGHHRGLRTRKPFRLEDCADDVARVADALGIDTYIPVGYSMGGTIAQLAWRRHPDRVSGLVLGATAPYFAGNRPERLSFFGLTNLARVARFTPAQARKWITQQVYLNRKTDAWGEWAADQIARHNWRMILEAGRAIGEFSSSDWLGEVDVPTSVICTMRDQVVPLRRQVKLFATIPDAHVYRVAGGHDAVVAKARRFVPQLIRAVESVHARSTA